MSAFGGLILTNKGRNLQSKAQAGVQLQYTRIGVGNGNLGSTSILSLNALINEVMSLDITKLKTLGDGKAVIGTVLTNQDMVEGFYFREIGLFATDPDIGEILYCYGNAGDLAEYISPGGGSDIIEKGIDIQTVIGNAQNVSAVINESLIFATKEDLENIQVPVTSVNGKVGDIVLTAADVGAETPSGAQIKASTAEQNAKSYADAIVAALVNSSPATLDTLNELAQALGDDPNFSTTVMTEIGKKLNTSAYTAADVLAKLKTVDGSGSGVDADLLDGKHASAFLLATAYTASDILAKLKTVDGSGSGLDADTVDGIQGSALVTTGNVGNYADLAEFNDFYYYEKWTTPAKGDEKTISLPLGKVPKKKVIWYKIDPDDNARTFIMIINLENNLIQLISGGGTTSYILNSNDNANDILSYTGYSDMKNIRIVGSTLYFTLTATNTYTIYIEYSGFFEVI